MTTDPRTDFEATVEALVKEGLAPDAARGTTHRLLEDGGTVQVEPGVGTSIGPFRWREPTTTPLVPVETPPSSAVLGLRPVRTVSLAVVEAEWARPEAP